jgi:hypothetical protein
MLYLLQISDDLQRVTCDFTDDVEVVVDHVARSAYTETYRLGVREVHEPLVAAILRHAYIRALLTPSPFGPFREGIAILESSGSKRDDFSDLSVPKLGLLGFLWNKDPTLRGFPQGALLHQHT